MTTPALSPNAELVLEALPGSDALPLKVHSIAQALPLTMSQVSAAIQELKRLGLATNPRGLHTNSWCRTAPEPVEEPVEPLPAEDRAVDPRVQEVERHLARIEGALAGVSSRLDEALRLLEASAEREQILVGLATAKETTR